MKINVMGTLRNMAVGESNFIIFKQSEARGTTLRNSASQLLESVGMRFHVHKCEMGYKVWRER